MALATRCPNCDALFRVVADQLKLRGGLVRCGSCRHVFDAIGSLAYVDDAAAPTTAPPTAASYAGSGPLTLRIAPGELPPPARARSAPAAAAGGELGVPTLMAPDADAPTDIHGDSAAAGAPGSAPAPDEEAAARARRERRRRRAQQHAERQPSPAATEADPESAPAFLRQGESGRRGFSIVFALGTLLLAATLGAQLAILFRTDLVTRFPALRPSVVQLCQAAGCSVGWPTRAELLAVVGSELQAIPGTDLLELTAVIRSRAGFRVALPAVEVTLTDTQNRTLARKVFAPVDYLASNGEPSSRIDEGLGAGSDYTVRITFEARGLNAAGFVVYPFYL